MTYDETIAAVADHYGYDSQSRQLVEEMAELTSAINHFWRKELQCGKLDPSALNIGPAYDHILEELGDVVICVDQLIYLLHGESEVRTHMKNKLKRQCERADISYGRTKRTVHDMS